MGEPEPLQKRFGHVMNEQQMKLLEQVIVIDPCQRLTAQGVLSTSWLADAQVPTPDRSQSRPVEAQTVNDRFRSSARPPRPQSEQSDRQPTTSAASSRGFAQAKPRVQRSVSPFCRQVQTNGYTESMPVVAAGSSLRVPEVASAAARTSDGARPQSIA